MYTYCLGFGTWEESHYDYLTHEIRFSEEEFQQAFLTGCVEVVKSWLSEPDSDSTRNLTVYSDITSLAASWLVANRGFRFLEVQASVNVRGWNPLTPKRYTNHSGEEVMSERFDETHDKEEPFILRRLRDEGLTPLIDAKNKKLNEICDAILSDYTAERVADWERKEKEDSLQ